jgi:hypothetical protein
MKRVKMATSLGKKLLEELMKVRNALDKGENPPCRKEI